MSCSYRQSRTDPTLLGHCAGGHDKDPTKLHCGSCHEDTTTRLRRRRKMKLPWTNIYENVADFRMEGAATKHVFINTLPEKYEVCNVRAFHGDDVTTVNDFADILDDRKPHCHLYCAHAGCSSAEQYAKRYWNQLSEKCSALTYIKPGAKGMLADDRFDLNNHTECRAVLS